MLKIFFAVGVLHVQVAVVCQQLLDGHFPGALVLDAVLPPGDAVGELFVLQGLRLAVAAAALWQRQLVVPDLLRAGLLAFERGIVLARVEEEQVGGDAGVGREDAVG